MRRISATASSGFIIGMGVTEPITYILYSFAGNAILPVLVLAQPEMFVGRRY